MCGFLITSKTKRINQDIFKKALFSIDSRGPDESIIYENDSLIFGFNRLSIQDLSSLGSQPMKDNHGNILCFNGEIYNFKFLRNQLRSKGESFSSNSDTEVLFKLIKIYGFRKSLDLIDGMFAFAYFDNKKNILYACRDPFGMKPIFISINKDQILLASEIKAMLPLMKSKKIDVLNTLNPLFYTGLPNSSNTMFRDIESINPGNYIEINLSNFSHEENNYFNLCSLVKQEEYEVNSNLNINQLTEKVSGVLNDSVESHLVADAKTGILFSAGLDSSLVAAISSNKTKDKINLFKYQSEDLDDSALAKEFAQKFNCNLNVTEGIDNELIYKLPYLIHSYETLNKADGMPLSLVCANAKKSGFKVLLTGDSADELFAGYGAFDQYRLNQYLNNKSLLKTSLNFLEKIFPGLRSIGIEEMHHLISPFDDRFIKPFLNFSLYKAERDSRWKECKNSYSFLDKQYEVNANAYILDDVRDKLQRFLLRSDRVGMSNSIELRLPFLTKDVAKLALNIPFYKKSFLSISYKRKRLFYDKAPLRYAAKKLGISNKIINRVKIGTPTGESDLDNIYKLGNKISFKNISELYRLKENTIKEFLNGVEFEPLKHRTFWAFISLEIYLKMFIHDYSPYQIENEFKNLIGK